MKKILIITTIIFFTLGLTSCDRFTSEDVEKISEEYCRENPTSDICEGDKITDLQTETVQNLFNDLLTDLDEGDQSLCDTYIAITNTTLLDSCRLSFDNLFPEDLEGYQIDEIKEAGSNDDITKYEIVMKKDEQSDIYIFTITIVGIEDQMYIDSWEFFMIEYQDIYQELLDNMIVDFNDETISNDTICANYFDTQNGFMECKIRREKMLNDEEIISISSFIINETEDHKFTIIFGFTKTTDSYTETVEGEFYTNEEDKLMLILIFDINFEISTEEVSSFFDLLIPKINDFSINTFTIIDEHINTLSQTAFITFRDEIELRDLEIESYELYSSSSESFVKFTMLSEEMYHFKINWTYTSGTWYLQLERYYIATEITAYDINTLLSNFINAFNTGSAPDSVVCNSYMTPGAIDTCKALRPKLWTANQHLELNELNLEESPQTVSFNVLNNTTMESEFLLTYDIDFTVIDGMFLISITNEFRLTILSLDDAESIIETMITDANDLLISDIDFCLEYGGIFADCAYFRSRISVDFLWAVLNDIEETEEDGTYLVYIGLVDMTFLLHEEFEFELSIGEDLEENPIIMGRELSDILIPPHENYEDILTEFLNAYFDETNTDQDIYDQFFDGIEFEGLYNRDFILSQDYSFDIKEITWHASGYIWYEAIVGFTSDGVEEEHTINYELYSDGIGGTNFKLMYPLVFPEETVINLYAEVFLYMLELEDNTADNFCNIYFNEIDYDGCVIFFNQFHLQEQDGTLGEITADEYFAEFLIDFTDSDTTLLFKLNPIYDLFASPHLKSTIHHPDVDLRNRLSTYMVDVIIYMFGTHGIDIPTYCLERAVCGTAFDDITSTVHHLTYVDVYWDFTNYFDPQLQVIVIFSYYDGLDEYHKYYATYVIEEDDYYNWTLHFMNKLIPMPSMSVLQNQTETDLILTQFASDIINETITAEDLCQEYYYGNMPDPVNCIINRDTILTDNATVVFDSVTPIITDSGISAYQTTYRVINPDLSEVTEVLILNIYKIPGTLTYYIVYY